MSCKYNNCKHCGYKPECEIYKENAELKADNDARKFAMAMREKVEKQLREENEKLTAAKDLLKRWVDDRPYTVSEQKDLIVDTEQFLEEE